jgi:Sulfotransferase family
MMNEDKFAGPVFIVGMPRSGKKLLRDLLNQNPRIGIPIHETGFIPPMADRFGNPPKLDDQYELEEFYEEFIQDPFFQQFEREGLVLRKEHLEKAVDKTSWHSILECIFRFYAPDGRAEDFVWGDKSPSYMDYMPLLKEILPKVRFIHCIRDPRDCCVSYKKAWGKSIYRAAESWRQRTEAALEDSHQLGTSYMEVFYESLLEDPQKTLGDVCEFLDCEFMPSMTVLSRSPEAHGDTRGEVRIVRENRKLYLTELTRSQVKRIEEIVCPVARAIGYELENDVEFKPVRPSMLKVLALYDAWASFRFNVHQYGLRQGFHRLYHWHTRGSWLASRLKLFRGPTRTVRRVPG